ncbi:MAG: DinB family protein [Acidobacteria bacterium]|nr:DinB family protein [Acidobacteriota bacterium]MCW5969722.1 DinB family protein [Blastocatellales bacterium]
MTYDIDQAISILSRTPAVLTALLEGLPDAWSAGNEGGDTWSPYDVVGHLIHGERADWIPRAKRILVDGESRTFDPFDRLAQFEESRGKTLDQLLAEFDALRRQSIDELRGMNLKSRDLEKTGIHPAFGRVTLQQLLATWVVHDLDHLAQISRVMAKQYAGEVGPWSQYLSILRDRTEEG